MSQGLASFFAKRAQCNSNDEDLPTPKITTRRKNTTPIVVVGCDGKTNSKAHLDRYDSFLSV